MLAVAAVLGVLAALTIVNPAYAVVEKSGSINCSGIGQQVRVTSNGTGTVRHYWPTGTLRHTFNNGDVWHFRDTPTSLLSTSWKVTATGMLNSSGTNAYCEPF
jgi:hypothetical protein